MPGGPSSTQPRGRSAWCPRLPASSWPCPSSARRALVSAARPLTSAKRHPFRWDCSPTRFLGVRWPAQPCDLGPVGLAAGLARRFQSEPIETRLAAVLFGGFMPKAPPAGAVEDGLSTERDGTQRVGQMPCLAVEWFDRLGPNLFRHGKQGKERERRLIGTMVPMAEEPRPTLARWMRCPYPATPALASSSTWAGASKWCTTATCRPTIARRRLRGPGGGSRPEATAGGGFGPVRPTRMG